MTQPENPQQPDPEAPESPGNPAGEQPADTAGEQDHADVEQHRGEDADPPVETGRPPE